MESESTAYKSDLAAAAAARCIQLWTYSVPRGARIRQRRSSKSRRRGRIHDLYAVLRPSPLSLMNRTTDGRTDALLDICSVWPRPSV